MAEVVVISGSFEMKSDSLGRRAAEEIISLEKVEVSNGPALSTVPQKSRIIMAGPLQRIELGL